MKTHDIEATTGRLHLKIHYPHTIPAEAGNSAATPEAEKSKEKRRDCSLCQRAQRGDMQVLECLVRRDVAGATGWKLTPNWCGSDWREEAHEIALDAAWYAACEFDATRGTRFEWFVQSRVRAQLLRRYRREFTYGRRTVPLCVEEPTRSDQVSAASYQITAHIDRALERKQACSYVREAIQSLPPQDRELIEDIFFRGITEEELGRRRHVSQRAVSKRKQITLNRLRSELSPNP